MGQTDGPTDTTASLNAPNGGGTLSRSPAYTVVIDS